LAAKVILAMTIALLLGAQTFAFGADAAFETFQVGLGLEQSLKHFEAADKFKEAIAAEPDNAGYLEHYAWFLSADGFPEEAAAAFRAALPHSANQNSIYQGLAWNEKLLGRFNESIADYGKAFNTDFSATTYRASFEAISARLNADNQLKVQQLAARPASGPEGKAASLALFDAYISLGELKSALEVGSKLAAAHPENLEMQLKLARVRYWSGATESAQAALQDLLMVSPDNAFLYYELGKMLHSQGKTFEATGALVRSISLHPACVACKKELAEVLAEEGHSSEALSLAASLDGKKGASLTAQLAAARVLHFSGNLSEAASRYRKILRAYPHNSDALWGLTETSLLTGRTDTAAAELAIWQQGGPDPRLERLRERLNFQIAPRLGLLAEYYANSAGFTRYNAGTSLKAHYLGTSFDLGYHYSAFLQERFHAIERNSLSLGLERRFSDSFRAELGGSANLYDNDQSHLNGKASLYFEPSSRFALALNTEHVDIIDTEPVFRNAIYNYVVTIGSVGRKVSTDDESIYARGTVYPNLDLWGKALFGFLSDGNRKTSFLGGADYHLSRAPEVTLGYSYFFLDYRKAAENYQQGANSIGAYYDPTNFEVHTVSLAYKQEFAPRFSLGTEGRLAYIPKSEGVAGSLFLNLSCRLADRHLLRLDAREFYQNKGVDRFASSNGGGHFRAENVVLSYEYVFAGGSR
jgi:tetratricopeptide (TPR) repeat protein